MNNQLNDVALQRIDKAIKQLSTSHSPVSIIDDIAKKLNSWQSNTDVLDLLFEQFSKLKARSEKSCQSLALSLRVRCLQISGDKKFSSKTIANRSLGFENTELMLFTKRNIVISLWRKGNFDCCCRLFEKIISTCERLNEATINTFWHLNGIVSSSLAESGLYMNACESARRGLYVADYLSSRNKVEYSLLQCSSARKHVAAETIDTLFSETFSKRIVSGNTSLDSVNVCFLLLNMMRNSTLAINTAAAKNYLEMVREKTESLPPNMISIIYAEQARLEIVSSFPKHAIGRMEDAAWILSWHPDILAQSNYNDVLSSMGQTNQLPHSLRPQCEYPTHSKRQTALRLESIFSEAWMVLGLSKLGLDARIKCNNFDII